MKFKIEVEAIRWDDSAETYDKLRFLCSPRAIVRDPQNRSTLLYGAVDTKEVPVGPWVIRFPDGTCQVYSDPATARLIPIRRDKDGDL